MLSQELLRKCSTVRLPFADNFHKTSDPHALMLVHDHSAENILRSAELRRLSPARPARPPPRKHTAPASFNRQYSAQLQRLKRKSSAPTPDFYYIDQSCDLSNGQLQAHSSQMFKAAKSPPKEMLLSKAIDDLHLQNGPGPHHRLTRRSSLTSGGGLFDRRSSLKAMSSSARRESIGPETTTAMMTTLKIAKPPPSPKTPSPKSSTAAEPSFARFSALKKSSTVVPPTHKLSRSSTQPVLRSVSTATAPDEQQRQKLSTMKKPRIITQLSSDGLLSADSVEGGKSKQEPPSPTSPTPSTGSASDRRESSAVASKLNMTGVFNRLKPKEVDLTESVVAGQHMVVVRKSKKKIQPKQKGDRMRHPSDLVMTRIRHPDRCRRSRTIRPCHLPA
uniref:Uncharacterized protein n=1 Tax=Plectus sambesii TaxID=2011161 RepID=A0A914VZK0_9BILA